MLLHIDSVVVCFATHNSLEWKEYICPEKNGVDWTIYIEVYTKFFCNIYLNVLFYSNRFKFYDRSVVYNTHQINLQTHHPTKRKVLKFSINLNITFLCIEQTDWFLRLLIIILYVVWVAYNFQIITNIWLCW